MKKYVQFGCGLDAPKEWVNYDASPTLIIQQIPIVGKLLTPMLNVGFPKNVLFGDIIKGLPEKSNSCDGVYSSHTLEHLSLNDFRIAIQNVYAILKPNGTLRIVVPDIEFLARNYLQELEKGNSEAAMDFIKSSLLGKETKGRNFKEKISNLFGNSHHLWMWDYASMKTELVKIGFVNIRRCLYNDSKDAFFELVERESRFINALAIECSK